ncbi:glycine oxidase ThiO [Aquibacillus kalidii]|uniref:glycine oxidase ThiO n=1 Tax=Aquibacillus kalidii TaxID=2762597 RepID=UPI00164942F9|nr:glycine oxidase ThiO [Aquibacillus kalidii]
MNQIYDSIVIGGGVIGGSIAYQLARRGQNVLLIEKDRIASKASSAAAGMLAVQAELEEENPLFYSAIQSRNMFPNLSEEILDTCGIDIELINRGMYKVAVSNKEVEDYQQILSSQKKTGQKAEWMSQDQLLEGEPYLSDEVLGAMFLENDGQVSAPQLTNGMIKAAIVFGAEVKEFTDVESLLLKKGRVVGVKTNEGDFHSENVVVTTGAWSRGLLRETGLNLNVYPVKGECLSVTTNKPILSRTIFSDGCYLVPKRGNRILVGASVKPYTFNQQVSAHSISMLLDKAIKLLPKIKDAEWEKAWAGIRPQTEDGLPYLGEHPDYRGLFVATGHFRNGILLSPITGVVMADLMERQSPTIDISAFRLDRHDRLYVNQKEVSNEFIH